MAALQCDICGGKLMGRPGGIFECDSCGMEYDTAWAKAKIQEIKGTVKVEGTVEVKGTVKLDGAVRVEGNATENSMLRRARVLLEEAKWAEAKDVIHQVLQINPECGQAYIYEYLLENKIQSEEALAYVEPGCYAIEKWNKLCQRVPEEDRVRLLRYRSSRTTRLTQEAPPSQQLMQRRQQKEWLQDCLNGGRVQGYWIARSISGKLYSLITEDRTSWAHEAETWPDGVTQLLCEKDWIIAVYADGTCRAAVRDNLQMKRAVESWENVKLVECHVDHILLLTYDGELSSYQWKEQKKEVATYYRASGWQNVEKLVGRWESDCKYVIGQTADGTLLSTYPLPAGFPTTNVWSFSEFFSFWIKTDGSCFIEEREGSWKEKLWPDQKELRLYRAGLSRGFNGSAVITAGGTLVERWERAPMIWQKETPDVLDCERYSDHVDFILRTDGTLMRFGKPIFPDRTFVALLKGSPWYAAVDTEGHITILGDVYGDNKDIPENAAICHWKIRWIIGLGVLLILYILIAFLIPFVKTATFWVSFVFTLIAFGVVAASIYIAFIKNPDAKSRFYGFPIAKIGAIYGLVQLIAGIAFMALAAYVPVWVAILVYAIALGAAVIGLISADAVVEEIHVQDRKLKKDVALMRGLQSKVNQMATQCDDSNAAASVKDLAEELRYSDPVSSDALLEIEADLSAIVDELQSAIIDGDIAAIKQLCRKASAVLTERNRLCKLNKT